MLRLRPYKSCDADLIAEWIKDKKIFQNWGGERFGWVIVDDTLRGKGYGKEMLLLGLKYAFDIFKVERVTIGVKHLFYYLIVKELKDVSLFESVKIINNSNYLNLNILNLLNFLMVLNY